MSENNETKFDPVTGQNVAQTPQPENPYVTGQNVAQAPQPENPYVAGQNTIQTPPGRRIHMIRWQRLSRQTKRI